MPERDHSDSTSSPEGMEQRESPEISLLRSFIADELDCLDRSTIERLPARDLLPLLSSYWNPQASLKHFYSLLTTYEGRDVPLQDIAHPPQFTAYLLHKLPIDLRERWEAKLETGTKTTEQLLRAVSRPDAGLILGFHVSPRDIAGDDVRIVPSADVYSDTIAGIREDAEQGNTAADTSAKSWYSTDPHHLYGQKKARYVYLVEGSRGDLVTTRQYQHGQVFTRQQLRIRARVPLTEEVIRSLDVRFDARGTI